MGASFGKLGSAFIEVSADLKSYHSGIAQAEKDTKVFSDRASSAMRGIGTVMVGFGVTTGAALGASIKTFANFEQKMANVASVSGATGEEFTKLSNFARKMGETTVFSATAAAEGMYYLASAGLKAGDQMKATKSILDLAAATQSGLAEATELTVSALKSFKLPADEADRVTNAFAATIGNSMATLGKIADSLPYVGTQFNSLGYSVEDASAALGILYDSGLRASMAGRGLASSLSKLLNPSKEAAAEINRLGINIDDVNPAANSLVDIVRQFEQHGLDAASASKIFGEQAKVMGSLVQAGAAELEELTKSITGTTAASAMAGRQLDTVIGDLKLLKSAAEGAAISVGEQLAPAFRVVVQGATQLVKAFNLLPDSLTFAGAGAAAATAGFASLAGSAALVAAAVPHVSAGLGTLGIGLPVITGLAATAGFGIAALTSTLWAAHRVYTAWTEPINNVAVAQRTFTALAKEQEQAIYLLNTALQRYESDGLEPTTATLSDLDINLKELNNSLGSTYTEGMNAVTVIKALDKSLSEFEVATANLKGGMEDTAQSTKATLLSFSSFAERAAQGLSDLYDAMGGINAQATETGKTWDDISKKIQGLTAITGAMYDSNTLQMLQYYKGVRDEGNLTAEAQRAVTNTIQEAEDKWFDASKTGFLEVATAQKDTLRTRSEVSADFTGRAKTELDTRIKDQWDASRERIAQEDGMNKTLSGLYEELSGHRLETITENEKAIAEVAAKARSDEEAKVGEHLAKITTVTAGAQEKEKENTQKFLDKTTAANEKARKAIQLANEAAYQKALDLNTQFRTQELKDYGLQRELILAEYEKMLKNFEVFGGGMAKLEKWKNEQIAEAWRQQIGGYASSLEDQMGAFESFAEAHSGLYGTWFGDLFGMQDEFHKTSLSQFSAWAGKQADLIRDLRTMWESLSTTFNNVIGIITTLSGWIGGGGGGSPAFGNAGLAGQLGNLASQFGLASSAATGAQASIGAASGSIGTATAKLSGAASAIGSGAKSVLSAGTSFAKTAAAWAPTVAAAAFYASVGTMIGKGIYESFTGQKDKPYKESKPPKWTPEAGYGLDFESRQAYHDWKVAVMREEEEIWARAGLKLDEAIAKEKAHQASLDASTMSMLGLGDGLFDVAQLLELFGKRQSKLRVRQDETTASTTRLYDALAGHSLTTGLEEATEGVRALLDSLGDLTVTQTATKQSTDQLQSSLWRSWSDIIGDFSKWTSITGEGYRASTASMVQYYENVRRQGHLTTEAERGVANSLRDLRDRQYAEGEAIRKKEQAAREKVLASRKKEEAELARLAQVAQGTWGGISAKFAEWTDITNRGYDATTAQAIAFYEAEREQGNVTKEAQIAISNTLRDLRQKQYAEAEAIRKKEEAARKEEEAALKKVADATKETGSVWEEISAKFKAFTDITSTGYKATTAEAIAFYKNEREQSGLTREAQIAIANTLRDLRQRQFEEAEAIRKKEEAARKKAEAEREAAAAAEANMWDEIVGKFQDWTSITGEGYAATTQECIAYYENVRFQGGLTAEAERGVLNTLTNLNIKKFKDFQALLVADVAAVKAAQREKSDAEIAALAQSVALQDAAWSKMTSAVSSYNSTLSSTIKLLLQVASITPGGTTGGLVGKGLPGYQAGGYVSATGAGYLHRGEQVLSVQSRQNIEALLGELLDEFRRNGRPQGGATTLQVGTLVTDRASMEALVTDIFRTARYMGELS